MLELSSQHLFHGGSRKIPSCAITSAAASVCIPCRLIEGTQQLRAMRGKQAVAEKCNGLSSEGYAMLPL
jgi:hypothetical protein